jgi:hypothetical protein
MWTTSFTGGLPHAFFTMHPAQAAKQKKPGIPPAPCFDRASDTISSLPSACLQKAPSL